MRRFLYSLLGSALLHAALLWAPLPMNAGDAGQDDVAVLRLRLVAPTRSAATKSMAQPRQQAALKPDARRARSEPKPDTRRAPARLKREARPAPATPPHVTPEPARVPSPAAIRVAKAALVTGNLEAAAPARNRPAPVARTRTRPAAAARTHAKPLPKPPRALPAARGAEPAAPVVAVAPTGVMRPNAPDRGTMQSARAGGGAPKPPDKVDGDSDALKNGLNAGRVRERSEPESALNLARGTPPRPVTAGAAFSPARYARTVKPGYPRKARRAGWEGTTLLKVLVNPDGAPGDVAVERTSGFGILDEAAVKAVQRWRFHPARRRGAPSSSWVRVPVAFRLKEVR